ncbi:aminotransferase class I/II-fold pyridoxal phosphate-dependent enzyme [Streptomyces sp. NPDC051567]|uniref:aminotransferase class I/II-fold pyridoxal phosphate-dependent enzyme n=1 Tax=Streptomyces sp. NPDC051567 TaxID=3365660 RepID=UPI00378A7003
MSSDGAPPRPGGNAPFARPAAGGLYRNTRSHRPGEVNLKSCGLLHPRAAALHHETLSLLDPLDVLTYPALKSTYAMVAERFGLAPGALVLTAGSDPGLQLLVRAFPGARRIVLHTPSYDNWGKFARIGGCALDLVPPDPVNGLFSLGDLAARLREGPPAFVVVTQPHSFTGQAHTAAELHELAGQVAAHGSLLVLDTAYLAFSEGGEDTVRALTGLRHVVRVNSFSKSYGLSGARIGVVMTHPDTAEHLLDIDAEASVSGPALALLRAALGRPALFEEIWAEVRGLRTLLARLVETAAPGWRARPGEGNFVCWDVPSPAEAAAATAWLYEHGFVIRDLSGFPGLPAAVRVSVGERHDVDRVGELLAHRHRHGLIPRAQTTQDAHTA